ncbi:diphosphomevalonate decarboxylase [Coemansia sp. RSA 1813]|nr:diphosphomevalonate decarboxylase [Coemansia sp. RSA 1646]KAJ1769364.1 diphosphomevalonate decarboxylase [Coemansia sp. RSA 1843]KAJ2087744.1 diphosphomevalonate decarboxylase [Coemansia sp. RSA 986]KAJ2213088.1 diphosphomevalonate decarboxylase [Coemansia sp. RSA 487]KAJ2567215.1 diphosphomevalonate decarboxylase [Coemansia sp. RSA 1813]
MPKIYETTVTAPVNIAVIKYWGKRDSVLILPTNSSLSVTLSQDHLSTRTTIRASAEFVEDRLWLNGVEEDIAASKRLVNSITTARRLREAVEQKQRDAGAKDVVPLSKWPIHVCSENSFPTAAGLASSASGYSALVSALGVLFELPQSASELSRVARVGSGSACRSMFGGFVAWRAGVAADGNDSFADQIADHKHWPELQALILVVSETKKTVPSTAGMQTTVETSELFGERVRSVVPKRMQAMEKAIAERDFGTFAEITMRDSNQFHAVCLDTYPPVSYMNDLSRSIANIVHAFNSVRGRPAAAYTYDAGPNTVIYALKDDMRDLVELFTYCFPRDPAVLADDFYADPFGVLASASAVGHAPTTASVAQLAKAAGQFPPGSVRRIIHTEVGDGPRVLSASQSLLNEAGMPKRAKE